LLYADGKGVAQDYVKARELYENAAARGAAYAMHNLALLYANGQGVAQDYFKAHELFKKAADMGAAQSMRNLALLYASGQGVTQDYVKALEWAQSFARQVETGESKLLGDAGEETAQALNVVAEYALFAREFTRALAVTDRAHALLPDNLTMET